ncbi:two-component sensor histidine kinase [Vibrio mimicus]
MNIKQRFNSLAVRTSLFLVIVVVASQWLASAIWYQHSHKRDTEGLVTTVRSLALSAASTISFFQTLPAQYRHLVLNQLRNMGGTRFFVSLNDHDIAIDALPESQRKTLVIEEVQKVLKQQLQGQPEILVEFTRRDQLKVFNNELLIDELPLLWAHYSLSYGELNPPILVLQVKVSPGEWFYLAAVLPAPYVDLETTYFERREWFTLVLSALLLLVCMGIIVQREITPIRHLAKAATLMSSRLKVPLVKEQGSNELKAAIRAFNKMHQRIDSHMKEREMLFSAISHDLKTPIACLKLRTEMLDDDRERERFTRIVNDLELMVKGALQCIRETDIHEEIEPIDLNLLVEHIAMRYESDKTSIQGQVISPLIGKPLALKRCIQNLVDNAIKYGHRAHIHFHEAESAITIAISDEGQFLDPSLIEKLCAPYYRAPQALHHEGNGLGLTISQSIAKAHGGKLELGLTAQGGLMATLSLPKDS